MSRTERMGLCGVALAVVWLGLLLPVASIAQLQTDRSDSSDPDPRASSEANEDLEATNAPRRIHWFPPRLYGKGIFFLPKLTYSDRRGLGLGGDAIFPFRWPGSSVEIPASDLRFRGRATIKGQTQVDLQAELHPARHYGIKLRLSHETLVERYYGIGPNTPDDAEEAYRPSDLRGYIEVSRDLWKDLQVGARFEIRRMELLETEDTGDLVRGEVRGSRGTENAVGTGLILDWDRRDSRYFPRSGFYFQSFGLFFDEEIGSDFDFNNYHFDARVYLSPGETQVFALQFFTYAAKGQPPFWHFAELGGRAHSRGYRQGRYRDRVLVAAQAEYRARLFWRLGIAGFFGVADVAPAVERMQLEHMKASFGAGPRFFLREFGNEMTVRFDIGLGGGVPRYYLSIGEAF